MKKASLVTVSYTHLDVYKRQHLDIMGDYDLVILAPQVASYYEDLKKDADRMGVKCIACEGKQYIDLTRNPKGALEFVFKIMGE